MNDFADTIKNTAKIMRAGAIITTMVLIATYVILSIKSDYNSALVQKRLDARITVIEQKLWIQPNGENQ